MVFLEVTPGSRVSSGTDTTLASKPSTLNAVLLSTRKPKRCTLTPKEASFLITSSSNWVTEPRMSYWGITP